MSLSLCDKENQILEEWKGQYIGDKFNGEEYLRRIQATTEDSLIFRIIFLTLFINNFKESMLMGTNQIKVVRKFVLVDDFSKLNLCKYMLDCFRSRKKLWKRDEKSSYYSGPITLLIINLGGFGRQFWDDHEDVDMKDETGGEEEQLVSFKRDFRDEEAYTAVLEYSYGLIVIEKHTMEVALKDGLEKIPDSVVLKEWMEKMNELFIKVHEGANNENVHEL
ncbi:unnamed protein product [Lactuca saligna]|uniref:Uncharacterized protein n=1 Tax=Lactuca saligna TaxID=75948 RepID=A0AA35YS94_LACSI|nr:unnamed protein product [Lactuca saligna]